MASTEEETKSPTSFKVLTWNIAHQSTLPQETREILDWPTRLESILRTLQSSDADIIMLQEVDLGTLRTDFKQMESKYDCISHVRNKRRTNAFGNATFWSRAFTHSGTTMGSRVLHTKLVIGGMTVTISNVHLPAMNGYDGYIGKLSHIKSCVKTWKNDSPIIFGGDFNDSFMFRIDGKIAGLFADISTLGFQCAAGELEKQTCKSLRTRNVHNVDHILVDGNLKITLIPSGVDARVIPSRENPSDHIPVVYRIDTMNEEPESIAQSDRVVIDILREIRTHAPVPQALCNLIAAYSMTMGDLLAYMPYIWDTWQTRDSPYRYPGNVYGGGFVYCSSTSICMDFDLWESREDTTLDLSGVDDLFSLLAESYPSNHDSDIPDAEIRKISDYYEGIARECLEHLLNSQKTSR